MDSYVLTLDTGGIVFSEVGGGPHGVATYVPLVEEGGLRLGGEVGDMTCDRARRCIGVSNFFGYGKEWLVEFSILLGFMSRDHCIVEGMAKLRCP